jgi:GNAT superfamily N-acetyltransferase
MLNIIRTDSTHKDFINLVKHLDAYLAEKDGDEHAFYDQFNKIDHLNNFILACDGELAVACGAIKAFAQGVMEVKRMYTNPDYRGKQIASRVLNELESWAKEMGNSKCILETGIRQVEAIALYQKNGYRRIENYGQYQNVENSICFEKMIG